MVRGVKKHASSLPEKGKACLIQLTILSDHFDQPVTSDTVELGSDLVVTSVMKNLHRVLQSKKKIPLDESFRVHALLLKHPLYARQQRPAMGGLPETNKGLQLAQWNKDVLRFSIPAPDLSFLDESLKDCCLLVTLVMGFERLKYHSLLNMGPAWRKRSLYQRCRKINVDDRALQLASKPLLWEIRDLCEKTGLNPQDFRLSHFDQTLDEKMRRLDVNVDIFVPTGGFRRVYSYPQVFDPSKAAINILAVPLKGSPDLYHTALIDSMPAMFSLRGKHMCPFCKNSYERLCLYFHKCKVLSRLGYEICSICRMRVPKTSDYIDKLNARHCCDRDMHRQGLITLRKSDLAIAAKNPKFACENCGQACLGVQCLKRHERYCLKYKSKYCEKCGSRYRKGHEHECYKSKCYQCGQWYGESSKHQCQMKRPKPQKIVSPIVVWDTETTVRDGRHYINSIGASFEHGAYGVFSEKYFYDDALDMPDDKSKLSEKNFIFDYFPEGVSPPKFPRVLKFRKSRKRTHSDFENSGDDAAPSSDDEVEGEGEFDIDALEREKETGGDMANYVPKGSAVEKFFNFFLDSGNFQNYTFLAHASSRFDSILILRALLSRNHIVEPIMDGNKILMITLPRLGIRFVDTFRYIGVALENFPARFPEVIGYQGKGSFPYLFNKPCNYAYEGPIPDEEHFFDRFSTEGKKKRTKEYISEFKKRGSVWKFRDQLHDYLKQDVHLLRAGVVALNKEFLHFQQKLTLVPIPGSPERTRRYFFPFNKPFFTGSSFVHAVWRYYAMPHDALYLLSNQTNARKTSRGEREWLLHLSEDRSLVSMFTDRAGQKKIGPYYVDGYEEEGMKVYEFNGCVVHGHLMENEKCPLSRHLDATSRNPFGLSIKEAYEKFLIKKDFLKQRGLRVTVKWECEFEREKETCPDLGKFLGDLYASGDIPRERLRIRDALRGGRTECFHLLYQQGEGNESEDSRGDVLYYDKNSLYPHVAIDKCYPVGKPQILIGEALKNVRLDEKGVTRLSDGKILEGLIQCTVLPPDSLFLPVLPIMCRDKLIYGLCRECMLSATKGVCLHSDLERSLSDTWTSIEIVHAIKCGYKILRISEMLMYERSEPLFRDFYMNLARIKLESEGFPSEAKSERTKQKFVDRINCDMPGLDLRSDRVSKNPSRRNFAKFVSILP